MSKTPREKIVDAALSFVTWKDDDTLSDLLVAVFNLPLTDPAWQIPNDVEVETFCHERRQFKQ